MKKHEMSQIDAAAEQMQKAADEFGVTGEEILDKIQESRKSGVAKVKVRLYDSDGYILEDIDIKDPVIIKDLFGKDQVHVYVSGNRLS